MKNEFTIKNAGLFDQSCKKIVLKDLLIRNGVVASIKPAKSYYQKTASIDLDEKILLKPFCDYHLHIPGEVLYDLYGVNLAYCSTVDEYKSQIYKVLNSNNNIIRGFGWNADIIQKYFCKNDGITELDFLNEINTNKPIMLFSDDFYSCWCNSKGVDLIQKYGINYENRSGHGSIFHMQVAQEVFDRPELSFTKEEISTAILLFQQKALAQGITEVFSFMFIGASQFTVLDILQELEHLNKLKIKFSCCYEVYPFKTKEKILQEINACRKYKSKHIDFVFAKIYIDGVIDNHSAWLSAHYADKDTKGKCLWPIKELQLIVDFLHENQIPIHAHAIGDMAVKTIAKCIECSAYKTMQRDIITHLQLCDKETIDIMAKNKIIACFQPFWFLDYHNEDSLDKKRLGSRADNEYPIEEMLTAGVKVLFSSDYPVTVNFNPLLGIKCACQKMKSNAEVFSVFLEAYTVNSLTKANSQIKVGDSADFVCFSCKTIESLLEPAEIHFVMQKGKVIDLTER